MKIAVNHCYGGFRLSPRAVKRIAELKGKDCYFFTRPIAWYTFKERTAVSLEELEKLIEGSRMVIWSAYTTPTSDFERMEKMGEDGTYKEANEYAASISAENSRPEDRSDPALIQAIEKLGDAANGPFARIEIIDIPDDAKNFYIDEYDGYETIREGRSW